jgi:diadenosine tetraphosphate (Ap4A) HIT family hydrolase
MPNATELKFQDPDTRVAQTAFWTVLLRPRQPTLGSLVLVCRESVKSFGDVSPAAFADLQFVVHNVETMLKEVVQYERINYLMLMMVDPDVHFHVLPRYSVVREMVGCTFPDVAWPGPPALEPAVALDLQQRNDLLQRLQTAWQRSREGGA